jgi:hypothetical protein
VHIIVSAWAVTKKWGAVLWDAQIAMKRRLKSKA